MAVERIGKYEVRTMLGQGGMGAVMLARDPDLDREVAIKMVMPHRLREPVARERFLREARALARLSDQHVVGVHHFEPEHDPPYLVMERLHGDDLRTILNRDGPLPPAMLRDCAWQCARGLAAAHAAGIVHRDIKPSNVMLCRDGVYKLIDFGLAESQDGDLTAAGEVVGTRRYIPPERLAGDPASPPADLWALGVLLCEVASGQHPYRSGGSDMAQLQEAALPPNQPAAFTAWVRRLLETDPQRRPRSGSEAVALLGGEAMPAPAPPADPSRDEPTALVPIPRPVSGSAAIVTATQRPPGATTATAAMATVPRPRLPFWLKLTATIWLLSSAAAIASGYAITERAVATQMQSLRLTLMGIAAGASQLVDPAEHARCAADPSGNAAAIEALRERLARFATAFPEVRYIYTMAPLPETPTSGVVQFICDASSERDLDQDGVIGPAEERADPGERYPAKHAPELIRGFITPGVDGEVTADQWGVWLSGYAPLLLPDGTSAGLVGVDVPAGHVATMRATFRWSSAALLAATLVAFLAAGLIIAWRIRRPVADLTRGMLAVAGGDYGVDVTVRSSDEFGVLAIAYQRMRDELRRAAQLRTAFDGFVTRALAEREGRAVRGGVDGARLAVAVQGNRDAAVTALLEAAHRHGGEPEGVEAGGICLIFPATHPGDLPQDRAVRCALAALAAVPGPGWACGVANGAAGARAQALVLARAGLRIGVDLLVDPPAFTAIAAGFYADQVSEREAPADGVPARGWAVKGAVSSAR